MSEKNMRTKKGKNFKEVIEQEKNKGKTRRKVMKIITSINSQIIYGGSFLLMFTALDVLIYYFLSPSVLVWAGILVGTALLSSIMASRLTKHLKKQQWKFAT
jgi:hypothetical protein